MGEKEFFDVVIIVPLEEEMAVVMDVFPMIKDRSTEFGLWLQVDVGNKETSALLVQQEREGRSFASKVVNDVLSRYDVGMFICVGIAGCLTDDLKLGDVVYTGDVSDVLDNAKASDRDGQLELSFSPQPYETPRNITHALNMIRMVPDLKPIYNSWQQERAALAKSLIDAPFPGRNEKMETIGEPNTKNGKLVCADVSKSSIYNVAVKAADRKFIAIETESGGIFGSAKHNNIPALTIRGLSDHADHQKNKLEEATGGLIRTIAAGNAASFLKLQFQNDRFLTVLQKRRSSQHTDSKSDQSQPQLPLNDLQSIITDSQALITERLGDISLELKYREHGYRLPVPRVRLSMEIGAIEVAPDNEEIDVTEILRTSKINIINIPRGYPDISLPYIIADYVLATATYPVQSIPSVVDGTHLRLPGKGIGRIVERDLISRVRSNVSARNVIIIENPPLQTQQKLSFFVKEIETFGDCDIICICREDDNAVLQAEFQARIAADKYHLCNVSFVEMAWFVQNRFSLGETEAEVVALKLQNTFDQYELAAHPSYFAGIPKQILFKLLEATGRAELIGLAVEGILLLLVSEDRAKVRVSKSRRAEFLKSLILQMKIEKTVFTEESLLAFVKEFAKYHDFEIDALQFIRDYTDVGILHFAGGSLQFSLPYMERFFLAQELCMNDEIARRYFVLEETDFDFQTFDLYCEIKPSEEIIDSVCSMVRQTARSNSSSGEHILLSKDLKPHLLSDRGRFGRVQERLRQLQENVTSGKENRKEKQAVLDAIRNVKKVTKEKSKAIVQQVVFPTDGQFSELTRVSHVLSIGVSVLGSGAESVSAVKKRALAADLIQTASLLIDVWTREYAKIDFSALKKSILTDEFFSGIAAASGDKLPPALLADARLVFSSVLDIAEFATLATPLHATLAFICERARSEVLAVSLENASPVVEEGDLASRKMTVIDELIKASWLSDIDSKRGREKLITAIKNSPQSMFLRVGIAGHLMERVYWDHWLTEDRKILLDAAEFSIKPFMELKSKPTILRSIGLSISEAEREKKKRQRHLKRRQRSQRS